LPPLRRSSRSEALSIGERASSCTAVEKGVTDYEQRWRTLGTELLAELIVLLV
jgi:hypothetical protein